MQAGLSEIIRRNVPNTNEKLYASQRSFQSVGVEYPDGRQVSIDEIRSNIAACLNEILERHDFKYYKSQHSFKRKTETGIDEIKIVKYDYVHYEFDFHFHKRIDQIQKHVTLFNFENKYNSQSDYKKQTTVWVCYSNIKKQVVASSYQELSDQLLELLAFTEMQIVPQLNRMNSLNTLNEILNYPEKDETNPFSYFSKRKFSSYAFYAGMVLAKMLSDPNYDKILRKYIENGYADEIKKMDEYLKNLNANA